MPLTGHMMLLNARMGAAEHGLTADDRILSLAPFGHLFGLYSVHLALYPGATMVLMPEFAPPAFAKVLAAGAEGELQFRGCSLFAGYLDNEAVNAEAFAPGGWFRTGDLAIIDEAGNLTLTGRTKDIINRGGVKFNPLDVERLLEAHPAVQQAAVAPVPDPVLGERACAYIVAAGDAPSLEELCGYLSENGIAKARLPERLEVVESMPMTATRKVIKGLLKPPGD